ncbi:phosphoglycolate phosphatase [Halomonas sp. GD1P12]|uniref:phosphoglycolate phosphatase n=1 Tax=Halomonas sp. GD1P12 TaxID=2982691 RepID=UPI0021E3D957|nr:phosphoglycolate phosphatase [Halomonas sp. GD1P12]UYG01069.1 phosphoglycolate phosphatase [Halomonas sp. GD1P12]
MHAILTDKRLIAFDLDGTLIDSVPDLAVGVQKALDEVGVRAPDEANVRDWVGNGARSLVERALTWALGKAPDNTLLTQAYEAFMRHYGAAPFAHTRVYDGVEKTLAALDEAGFALALITNKPERFIAPILEHFGLLNWFALCIGGDTLVEKKPSALPLLHAANTLGAAPKACVMVGDSKHDIEAGRAAGFATVALPYGYNHGEPIEASRPDLCVASLTALLD